ncbi:hypothetical protein DER29_6093 [Micromonospora sp. M71_S20]|nr:hypothetical protein DER29_6093 [Micromonospora sp. M71_S20]
MSVLVVVGYRSEALDPAALAALARNPAIRTLFGEPVALDQAGGFTVRRTGTVLAVLLGVWAMLAATRSPVGKRTLAGGVCCCPAAPPLPRLSASTSVSWPPFRSSSERRPPQR